MPPLLGIDLIYTNENFAIKRFSEQVREMSLMTVELPTPQKTLQRMQITDIVVFISNQRYSYILIQKFMNVPLLGQGEHVIGIMFAESDTKIDLEA